MIDPLTTFLISSLTILGGFIGWLVKQVIKITKDFTEVTKDVKNSLEHNTSAVKENTAMVKDMFFSHSHYDK